MAVMGYEDEDSLARTIQAIETKLASIKALKTRLKKVGGRVEMEGAQQNEKAIFLLTRWLVNFETGLSNLEHGGDEFD